MATEPPTPPNPGGADAEGPDATAQTPPTVSFAKSPTDPAHQAVPAESPQPGAVPDPWAPPQPGSVPPPAAPPAAPPAGGFGPPVPPAPYGAAAPYGAPQGVPYGGFAPQPPVSGLAVTSLVFGVLCCVPLFGVVFGVAALVRMRKQPQRGKGLAIAGIALSAVGSVLLALALATGAWGEFRKGFSEGIEEGVREANVTASLEPGDCFDEPGMPEDAAELERYEVDDIREVDCAAPHDGEAFARVDLPAGAYPGEDEVVESADSICSKEMTSYSKDAWRLFQHAYVTYFYPAADNWAVDDRSIVCVYAPLETGERLTGELRQDKADFDAQQLAYLDAVGKVNAALVRTPFDAVEEDLEGYRKWAGDVSDKLAGAAEALRAHDWKPDAAPLAASLADEIDAARGEWKKLAGADDTDDFYLRWGEADSALTDGAGSVADLREHLGLGVERPDAAEFEYFSGAGLL
ncbi:DUF4190 domain-containing protein [Streptomyces sp. NPDC005012]|uniref:DUF4190 domain-containing protein n=1 Tax=Streptomyces sp. NPDC005012 TaxID=3154558 RepID=UPI0033BC4CE1